jgi:hypothetical protein
VGQQPLGVADRVQNIVGAEMTIDMTADHRYIVDGRQMPGVTAILSAVLGDPTGGWGSQWHMDKGNAAHALYAILARGQDLDLYDYDARLDGHVQCWRDWSAKERPHFVAVEHKVASWRYGYAGTLDAVAIMRQALCLIDYKATSSRRDLMQMAAYALAWEEMGGDPIKYVQSVQIDGARWVYGPSASGLGLRAAIADWHAVRRVWEIKQGQ